MGWQPPVIKYFQRHPNLWTTVFGTSLGVAAGASVQNAVTAGIKHMEERKKPEDRMSAGLIRFVAFLCSFTVAAAIFLMLWFLFGFGYSAPTPPEEE